MSFAINLLKLSCTLLIIIGLLPLLVIYLIGDALVRWLSLAIDLFRKPRAVIVLVLLLVLVLVRSVQAGDVHLAWDASPTPGVTYTLYAHTNSMGATNLTSALVKVNAGTNLTALVENLRPPATWYFVATAVLGGIQSDPSNQVVVQVPPAPANARTLVVQYGITITNFTDTGFFRLRIPAP